MQQDSDAQFLTQDPKEIKKEELVKHLKDIQMKEEISWLITDEHSYGWTEINEKKRKFLKELESSKFKTVCVGVFNDGTKETTYSSYRIKHR